MIKLLDLGKVSQQASHNIQKYCDGFESDAVCVDGYTFYSI